VTRRAALLGLVLVVLAALLAWRFHQDPASFLGAEPASLHLEERYPGLTFQQPVHATHAGDGSGRVFVVEKRGLVLVVTGVGSAARAEPWLDLQEPVAAYGGNDERGLLGIAFAPDFATSGALYVHYTTAPDGDMGRVSRLRVPEPGGRPDPASEQVLLEVLQPWRNHNGGALAFDREGYLLVGLGDGGAAGDPRQLGQDMTALLGKILRLDVSDLSRAGYAIPSDNPFADGASGVRPEIWVSGLRNPWRFSVDPDTGEVWVGDVGQNAFEEIDLVSGGENLGWNRLEGFACFRPSKGCDPAGTVPPVCDLGRSQARCITGGLVYRGARRPDLRGAYVFGDFVTGKLFTVRRRPGSHPPPAGIRTRAGFAVEVLGGTGRFLSSFGETEDGELLVVDYYKGKVLELAAL
jgi:glucose/arabinose dehydrogenase